MKIVIVLTAVAVLTIGNAIAALPGTAGSMRTISADSAPVVSMAAQQLPFDPLLVEELIDCSAPND
jgi:hypothetical protein